MEQIFCFSIFFRLRLPGVFASNLVSPVDGALWTLKIEVAFYLFVPILHALCNRFGAKKVIGITICISYLWNYILVMLDAMERVRSGHLHDGVETIYYRLEAEFPSQLLYFCAGILLLLYFDQLTRRFREIFGVTAVVYLVDHWLPGSSLDVIWISGVVFIFGFWRYFGNFSKYGDFSYGVYIIHWPILQTLISLGIDRMNPAIYLLISVFCIGLTGFLMWHFVESRFLKGSSHYLQTASKATGPC